MYSRSLRSLNPGSPAIYAVLSSPASSLTRQRLLACSSDSSLRLQVCNTCVIGTLPLYWVHRLWSRLKAFRPFERGLSKSRNTPADGIAFTRISQVARSTGDLVLRFMPLYLNIDAMSTRIREYQKHRGLASNATLYFMDEIYTLTREIIQRIRCKSQFNVNKVTFNA